MSGARFTKGPWSVRDMSWSAGTKHFIDGADGRALATTFSKQSSDPRVKAEITANARLIAAAPDLYEAAKSLSAEVFGILRAFEAGLREEIGNTNYAVLLHHAENAAAALNKALGK